MNIRTKITSAGAVALMVATSLFAIAPSVSAQVVGSTVTRSFSSATPISGTTLTVTLTVDIVAPDTFYAIDELVPAGWTITSATGGGDFTSQAGHVKWVVISGAVPTSYDYTVTVPATTGIATFSGTYGTDSIIPDVPILGATDVTVQEAPVLTTITVSPSAPSITVGATQQFTATAVDQFGVALAVQPTFAWTSGDTAIATIDAATGLATGVSAGGPVTVTATSGAVTGTSALTVTAIVPVLTSVSVAPATATAVVGATQQFIASPIDQLGAAFVGATIAWSSSDATVASVDAASGLMTALAVGTTTITATATSGATSVTGTSLVTVVPVPVLTSIAVTPATSSIAVGSTAQFSATALDQTGVPLATQPVITWSSGDTAVATITPTGLATALTVGTSTISAISGAVSGTATLSVTPVPVFTSITVSATSTSLIVGSTTPLSATALDQFAAALVPQPTFTWASASSSIASVDATGLVTAVSVGTTALTVSSGALSATVAVTVTPVPVLTSITVVPATASVAIGATKQFTATAFDQFGVALAIQPAMTWSSGSTTIASVDTAGLVSGLSAGTTTITAASGAVSGSAALTVLNQTLASVIVMPSTGIVQVGRTLQMRATGIDQAGTILAVQPTFTWVSANPGVASISASGLVTGVAVGTSTLTASSGLVSGTALLTVSTSTRLEINDDLGEIEREGCLSPEGEDDYATTTALHATHDIHITLHSPEGNHEIELPEGVRISREDGERIDGTALAATSTPTGSLGGFGSSLLARAALKWGLAGRSLQFTAPITLRIFVGSSHENETLNVVRSVSGTDSWTSDGIVAPATCIVTNGQCTFQATKASYYVAAAPVSTPPSGGGSGSGGGGGFPVYGSVSYAPGGGASNPLPGAVSENNTLAIASTPASTQGQGEVLGASVYNFTNNLSVGSKGSDVTALQQFLIDSGYAIPAGVTGYFGAQTRAAVIAFQKANSIAQTGFVGPLTRAELNKGSVAAGSSSSGLTSAQVSSILAVLQSFGVDDSTMSRIRSVL